MKIGSILFGNEGNPFYLFKLVLATFALLFLLVTCISSDGVEGRFMPDDSDPKWMTLHQKSGRNIRRPVVERSFGGKKAPRNKKPSKLEPLPPLPPPSNKQKVINQEQPIFPVDDNIDDPNNTNDGSMPLIFGIAIIAGVILLLLCCIGCYKVHQAGINDAAATAAEEATEVADSIGGRVMSIFGAIWRGLVVIFRGTKAAGEVVVDSAKAAANSSVGKTITEGASTLGHGAMEGAKKAGHLAVDGAKVVGGLALDGTKTVGGYAVEGGRVVGETLVDGSKAVGGLALEGGKVAGQYVVEGGRAVVEGTKTVGSVALEEGKELGGAALQGGKAVGGMAVEGGKAVGGLAMEGGKVVGGMAVDGTKATGQYVVEGGRVVGAAASAGTKAAAKSAASNLSHGSQSSSSTSSGFSK